MRVAIEEQNIRDYLPEIPVGDRCVTWIIVEASGRVQSAKNTPGKEQMLLNAEDSDRFYLAWTGEYSTDIFTVPFAMLKERTKDWYVWHPELRPKPRKKK